MALISNIVIDNIADSATLTITFDGSPVEKILFNNVDNQLIFSERGEIFISGVDFIDYMEQIKIFEVAILFNFSTNNTQTIPFNQVISDNTLDVGAGQWNMTISSQGDPLIIEYSAILSSLDVLLHKRGNTKTIEYTEWIIVLNRLKFYQIQVRDYFSL